MERPITGFQLDDNDDWVARLSCGHGQHVRHRPPFANRPWVTSEAGRASRLGARLNCVRCDKGELPETFVAYQRTPEFTEGTIPTGLTANHATASGIWGRITVIEGRLRYCVERPATVSDLRPDAPGTIVPEVPHHVEPDGPVRFYVEFLRAPDTGP